MHASKQASTTLANHVSLSRPRLAVDPCGVLQNNNNNVININKNRASSILQRNAKVYGPANALTADSSCWNSEGDGDDTATHWFRLDFGRVVQPTAVALQFQAGFCATTGRIECQNTQNNNDNSSSKGGGGADWQVVMDNDAVEWQDDHELQTLSLAAAAPPPCTALRIVLQECTDFYGRVILYQVQVWGTDQVAAEETAVVEDKGTAE